MTKITVVRFLIASRTLSINNPYLIATIFIQLLLIVSFLIGMNRTFIGLILFLVYVGGIIILIRYCVILIPSNKFERISISLIPIVIAIVLSFPIRTKRDSAFSYGLLYNGRLILILSLLLYLVMVAVVSIIDYARGIIKIYCESIKIH